MSEVRKQGSKTSAHRKSEFKFEPVVVHSTQIAHTWWGQAWNRNLENYADFSNRLPRGKSYLRSGMLQGLCVDNAYQGDIMGLVQGSRRKPYEVLVRIQPLGKEKWQHIVGLCENKIAHVATLLESRFSPELGAIFLNQKFGLFPAPGEIVMACTCPDWSHMCKHVATTLYAIGAKLDTNPALLFELRGVDIYDLLLKSSESKLENILNNAHSSSSRIISDEYIDKLFNL